MAERCDFEGVQLRVDTTPTLPTIADRPTARGIERSAEPSTVTSAAGTAPTLRAIAAPLPQTPPIRQAVDAMRHDEIARARVFYVVIMIVAAGMILALPFMEGDRQARWVFGLGLLIYAFAETWFVRAIRNPARYTNQSLAFVGFVGVTAGYGGVYYWGAFSPAPAMIVMALYFNSLVGSFRYTLFVYLSCATLQAALAGLVMTGAIVDRGLIDAADLGLFTQLATQGFLQAALLATFLVARLSRRSTQDSIERLEQAVREVAHRDALLSEARQELDRAARVGDPGRFTEQVLGSFRLGVIIGRGAMGEVYEGFHTETGEPAAIKMLHTSGVTNPGQVARFTRETQVVASLNSPHVVSVLEVADSNAPIPYLAMERLNGEDLSAILRHQRRLPLAEVSQLVREIAEGLEAARKSGIVHRDLKPQNLFLARTSGGSGVWKILDFGVSKLVDHSGTLTRGRVVGTPSYMAPEQARGKRVDHRADVYALGAIAYRALTGFPAFSGAEVPQVLYNAVHQMPRRPSDLAKLSEDIDAVLAIALAKKPGQRYASAAALAGSMTAAMENRLSDEDRRRAQTLLRELPWGAVHS